MKTKDLESLLDLIEDTTGATDQSFTDDESVYAGEDGQERTLTFGHIRRARAELDAFKALHNCLKVQA